MIRKIKILCVILFLAGSISFTDNYFEISKNIDIFTTLYKELNLFYVDDTDTGKLMKVGMVLYIQMLV